MILLRIICMQLIPLNKPSLLISLTDMNFSMRQIILNQINWIHVTTARSIDAVDEPGGLVPSWPWGCRRGSSLLFAK